MGPWRAWRPWRETNLETQSPPVVRKPLATLARCGPKTPRDTGPLWSGNPSRHWPAVVQKSLATLAHCGSETPRDTGPLWSENPSRHWPAVVRKSLTTLARCGPKTPRDTGPLWSGNPSRHWPAVVRKSLTTLARCGPEIPHDTGPLWSGNSSQHSPGVVRKPSSSSRSSAWPQNPHPACSGAVPASKQTQPPQAIHPLHVSRHSDPSRRSETKTEATTDLPSFRKSSRAVSKFNSTPKAHLPFILPPSSFRLHPSEHPLRAVSKSNPNAEGPSPHSSFIPHVSRHSDLSRRSEAKTEAKTDPSSLRGLQFFCR
jgi:hypothetical protein